MLVSFVNQLYGAFEAGEENDALSATFISMLDQAEAHISDEENLLLINGYPDLAALKAKREKVVKQMVQDFRKHFQDGGAFAISMVAVLADWLINHIWGDGELYGPYLSGKAMGKTWSRREICNLAEPIRKCP